MNEEELKALLGDNYDGAKDFFKNQVLGNGDYVTKGKADADKQALQKQLEEANKKIKENMTDEEQRALDVKAKDDLISKLQEELKGNKIEANQAKAIGNVAEATTLIGLKSDDKDFTNFISNIATEDDTKTVEVSQYVNKIVKEAFEKGKAEATKQNLGKMGTFKANGSGEGSQGEGSGTSIAERLAKENAVQKPQSSYFKN